MKHSFALVSGVLIGFTAILNSSAADGNDAWPFDAAAAARRQTETSQALKLPIVLQTPLAGKDGPALTWRLIPPGKFMMGSPTTENGHEGDERLHAETIAEAFYMAETQLTVEQYRALMRAEPLDVGDD